LDARVFRFLACRKILFLGLSLLSPSPLTSVMMPLLGDDVHLLLFGPPTISSFLNFFFPHLYRIDFSYNRVHLANRVIQPLFLIFSYFPPERLPKDEISLGELCTAPPPFMISLNSQVSVRFFAHRRTIPFPSPLHCDNSIPPVPLG